MKEVWKKKQSLAFAVIIILLIFMGVMSIMSIQLLHGNARVVNYVGIVRGATQKLIKEEIMGWHLSRTEPETLGGWYPNDALVARLDSIVDELLQGNGPNGLVVLPDATYLDNMRQVRERWGELKGHIARVRRGEEPGELFRQSQEYFTLVDTTVFSAETYSETQVRHIKTILYLVNGVVIFLLTGGIILYLRSLAAARRADTLDKIAYVDPLTKIHNRARCEQMIEYYKSAAADQIIAVFMFDMNDLKLTNDFFGHQGGDRIIIAFAQILNNAAGKNGFVGRFGGDEFLAIFAPGDVKIAETFLRDVRELTDAYNSTQANKLETIRYAGGYTIANACERDIEDIIHEADNRMYENKRLLKTAAA